MLFYSACICSNDSDKNDVLRLIHLLTRQVLNANTRFYKKWINGMMPKRKEGRMTSKKKGLINLPLLHLYLTSQAIIVLN